MQSLWALKQGPEFYDAFVVIQEELEHSFEQFSQAIEKRESSLLERAFKSLGPACDDLSTLLDSMRSKLDSLPILSDQTALDEVIFLSLNLLQGESSLKPDLKDKLPLLVDWSRRLQTLIDRIQDEWPEEKEIAHKLDSALQDLTEAIGGFVVFLKSDEARDLSLALSLFDRALRTTSACLAPLRRLRHLQFEFSKEPVLELLHQSANSWANGEASQPTQTALMELIKAHIVDLELARQHSFLPFALHQELLDQMDECRANLCEILKDLTEDCGPEDFLAGLKDFRDYAQDFDVLLKRACSLEDPGFTECVNFRKLFELMKDVYLECLPDERLRERLHLVSSAHQQLMHRASLTTERSEEESFIEECLKEHEFGIAEIEDYLVCGQRALLLKAYELLLPALFDLVELSAIYGSGEDEKSLDFVDSDSQSNQSRCFRQIRSLTRSHHGAQGVEQLQLLLESAESARRELSETVRPLIVTHSNPEVQGSFEQLTVILEYHLDGLYQLEQALQSQGESAVECAVQELAEVDAYLNAFLENQEKLVGSSQPE